MSKYTPLEIFLRDQRRDLVPMTFAEIERVIGAPLPLVGPKAPTVVEQQSEEQCHYCCVA